VQARAREAAAAFKTGEWSLGISLLEALVDTIENGIADEEMSNAKEVIERWYRNKVDAIAEGFISDWRDGSFQGSRESAMESLEQSCDTACTYTHDAQLIIVQSRSDSAYVAEFGEPPVQDGDIQWGAIAMWALREDVLDLLRHKDIDVNEDPPSEPQVECSECSEWKTGKDGICDDCREEQEDDDLGEDGAGEGDEPCPGSE